MHSTRVSSMCLMLLVLWFSSCLVSQASRACYVCESPSNETCFTNVDRNAFQMDCVKAITEILKKKDDSIEHLQALIQGYAGGYSPVSITDFECVTFIGVASDNVETTVKACVPKFKDCDILQIDLRLSGFLPNSCDRCDTNLCNTQNPIVQEVIPPTQPTPRPTHYRHAENHAKATQSEFLRIGCLCAVAFLVSTFLIV